jgi:hypothetical protein
MIKVNLSREELKKISTNYMSKKGYLVKSISENQIIFTGGKDIDNTILILAFLILLIGGILYYVLSKTHTITINFTDVTTGLQINAVGSTKYSISIAEDFMDNLVTFSRDTLSPGYSVQEIKCPRCGSSLDYKGKGRFIECSFCGANLAVNEL